jgi:stress response protein YsnF
MRTFTALYDSPADAERVQSELERLGVIDADDRRVHTGDLSGAFTGDRGAAPPEPDRRLYEEGVRRGGALLTVNVDDQSADEALRIIEGSNPVDLEAREAEYRQAGHLQAAPAASPAVGPATELTGETRIPVVEERLVVGKREVERGGLRVRSYVRETPVQEQVSLHEEHVEIERRPVNERLTGAATAEFRDREIEMTERAEVPVVAKESRIIEEVVVRKEESDRTEEIEDTVRRTEVDVERLPGSDRRV